MYAFDAARLRSALQRLDPDNAQGELYLPDVVAILVGDGRQVRALRTTAEEIAGVNEPRPARRGPSRLQRAGCCDAHMDAGVTVVDPATTWIDASVRIERGRDAASGAWNCTAPRRSRGGATIGPDVSLTDTAVGEGARISRAVACRPTIGAGCEIGPFAYLRPGTKLADAVKIGTYVEVKGSDIGTGTQGAAPDATSATP